MQENDIGLLTLTNVKSNLGKHNSVQCNNEIDESAARIFGVNFSMFQYFDWVGFLIYHSSYSLLLNKTGLVTFAISDGFGQKMCQIAWTKKGDGEI